MSTRQDKRRLLGPAGVQRISFSNSNISAVFGDAENTTTPNSLEDEITVERDVLQNTANSSTLYSVNNAAEFLSLLSSLYVKPYKQQFVEKCVINVNFENFVQRNLTTYEQFLQNFLESTIILSDYPKSGLDFFIKDVTSSNAINANVSKTEPVDLNLLKHIITSAVLTLLEANINIKYFPAVGISKSKQTITIYIKNETEILSYYSNVQERPLSTVSKELEECKADARVNRLSTRSCF